MSTPITDLLVYAPTVTAPDDADPLDAASVTAPGVGFQALADRTNNLVQRVGGASGAGEHAYVDAAGNPVNKPRTRIIGAFAFTEGVSLVVAPATTSQWFSIAQFIGGANSYSRTSQHDRATIVGDISKWMPPGSTVTRLEALVAPGIVRATVADRMHMELYRQTPNFAAPAIPTGSGPLFTIAPAAAGVADDGTFNVQVLDSGIISEAVDRFSHLTLRLYCGNNAGTSKDDIHAVKLTFDVPGPNVL